MSVRADRDDARVAGGGESVAQAEGEREMPEMVRGELRLPALTGAVQVRQGHDARVVDQNVQWTLPRGREGSDGGTVGQFQPGDQNTVVAGLRRDLGRGAFAGFDVPDRERHLGSRRGQSPRGLDADARCTAGDNGTPAGQVDAGDDLFSGRFPAERGADADVADHDDSVLEAPRVAAR